MSLILSDIEQVYPIKRYTEEEVNRCTLDLYDENLDIRKDCLKWLGVKRLLDAVHLALRQGDT